MTPVESLERFVRAVLGDYRYERTYPSVVERSYDGGDVDVLPDDDLVRGIGLQRVPAPSIAPSTFARAEPGARCLLAFAEGNPRKPQIIAWEYAQNSATVQLDGGTAAVARKGDLVDVFLTALGTPIAGVISGQIITSPGPPPVVSPLPPGAQFVGVAAITTPVRGAIIGGAPKVKA